MKCPLIEELFAYPGTSSVTLARRAWRARWAHYGPSGSWRYLARRRWRGAWVS